MPVDLDRNLRAASAEYLREVIGRVKAAVNDPAIPQMDEKALQSVLGEVLSAATPSPLLALLRDRLVAITGGQGGIAASPDEFIAVANPSVQRLKRHVEADGQRVNQFSSLLEGSEGYPCHEIGCLLLEQNPYFAVTDAVITDQQIMDAKQAGRRRGPFRGFNADSPWDKTDPTFAHIPHPSESHPGFDRSWYMVNGMTPKSVPDPPPSVPDARNVVKSIEIEYGDPIDTGELLPDGTPKKKKAHVFIMYAGGNSS